MLKMIDSFRTKDILNSNAILYMKPSEIRETFPTGTHRVRIVCSESFTKSYVWNIKLLLAKTESFANTAIQVVFVVTSFCLR